MNIKKNLKLHRFKRTIIENLTLTSIFHKIIVGETLSMTVFWENDVEVEFSMTVSKKTNVKLNFF